MGSSLNATSSIPPFTDVSVDPTQNRSVPSFPKRLWLWSRARDRGGECRTERLIPEARNHPSQTGGNPDHHSSTTTAPSTSEGSLTTTGSHRASPSTCAQSTGRLAQSHEQQGSNHCDPRSMRWEETCLPGGREEPGDKKMEKKKMKKGRKFSKCKGEL